MEGGRRAEDATDDAEGAVMGFAGRVGKDAQARAGGAVGEQGRMARAVGGEARQGVKAMDAEDQDRAVAGGSGGGVVFLVNVSGSMVDSLPEALKWLSACIDDLDASRRFTVILFRSDEALELGPAGLKVATEQMRKEMREFLARGTREIRLGGRADVMEGLKRTMQYEVDEVFILSDDSVGRRLSVRGVEAMLEEIDGLMGLREVRIHGVQFFYDDPRGVLAQLAERYGGEYRFIGAREVEGASAPVGAGFGR
jgi:hypothetical protein